ncbi:MAG: hypothetical protein MMC23_000586 [Stictis urceolatum]|nr:hypothetical protein [Stictis urceolata]
MSVILEPPQKVKLGDKFDAPLVVALSKDRNPTDLMSVLSVISEDGKTAIAPPAPDVIAGNTSGSLQILDHGKDKEQAIHLFRDLRLRRPGRYRLRISMMKREGESYVNVHTVVSRVIAVDTNVSSQISAQEKDTLQRLRSRGLRA